MKCSLAKSKDAHRVFQMSSGRQYQSCCIDRSRKSSAVSSLHYAPYEIGSYAEGAYHITLPQAGFHDLLKPEYADLFAGDPADIQRFGD
jgi:hypothetical protein